MEGLKKAVNIVALVEAILHAVLGVLFVVLAIVSFVGLIGVDNGEEAAAILSSAISNIGTAVYFVLGIIFCLIVRKLSAQEVNEESKVKMIVFAVIGIVFGFVCAILFHADIILDRA